MIFLTKEDTDSSKKWVIFPKQKYLIGMSTDGKFSSYCDVLLGKGCYSSLSENALFFELPDRQFKIIAFEENLDVLIAMAVIKMRQDGFRISERSKYRIQMMPQMKLQNVLDVLLMPNLDFSIRLNAAKWWLMTVVLLDAPYLESNQSVRVDRGTVKQTFRVPDNDFYVSSR